MFNPVPRITINAISFIEIWCNGSTRDFGSLSPGSNPGISTNTINNSNIKIKHNVVNKVGLQL